MTVLLVVTGDGTHIYLSTYCIHQRHNDCRLTCKICSAPCACACHKAAEAQAAKDRAADTFTP